jgi:hypothetical protein
MAESVDDDFRPHIWYSLGILLLLAGSVLSGCAPSQEEDDYASRRALLVRQNQGIRELIAEAEKGSLIPSDRFLVGIDESIVTSMLDSELPLERPMGKQFLIRLERARVLLRDKFGLVTIDGSLYRPSTPDRKTAVRVLGGLGAVTIDTTSDVLITQVAIDHIELQKAGALESVLGRSGKKFIAEKGRDLLQDKLPTIRIPVVLARRVRVPAVEQAGFRLEPLIVPIDLSVERVIAAGGKLWVTLNTEIGEVTGARRAVDVTVKMKKKPSEGSK